MSFTTSAAIIRPAVAGTNALLPGTCLRSRHVLVVPGGHMQFALQSAVGSLPQPGFIAGSFD